MATKTLFITGTDTGVGKTHTACLVIRHLRERGVDAVGYKPVCCGDRDDAEALAEASGMTDLDRVNPVWFASPLAPAAAAKRENRSVDRCAILDGFEALCSVHDRVIVEGAGGWEVPLTETESMAGLAAEFGGPVLIVAANRLGAVNHTLLTFQAVAERGLPCLGVVLNEVRTPDPGDLAVESNRELLQSILPETPVVTLEFRSVTVNRELAAIL